MYKSILEYAEIAWSEHKSMIRDIEGLSNMYISGSLISPRDNLPFRFDIWNYYGKCVLFVYSNTLKLEKNFHSYSINAMKIGSIWQ